MYSLDYDAVENVKKNLTFCTHLLVEIARLVHVVLLHELDYLVIASVIGPAYTHTQIYKYVSVKFTAALYSTISFTIWP